MTTIYSRQQILEKLEFWKRELVKIDESNNKLIDALISCFKTTDLFKDTNTKMSSRTLNLCYDTLNKYFFSSKLSKIPIIYASDSEAREFLISRKMKSNELPKVFFGTHSVLYDNNPATLKWNDELKLHDDVIVLNASHIDGRSIAFLVACMCHEMIHYYDRLFGEYCSFAKYSIITKIDKDVHNTMTFETKKEEANDLGVNVIQEIPKNKDVEILDKEAIELLYKKAKEDGLVLEGDERMAESIGTITIFPDHSGGSINTF